MSEENGIHATVPPRHSLPSNGYVEFTELSQEPEETYEDINSGNYSENRNEPEHSAIKEEEYHCRTCLNVADKDSSVWIMETIISDKTIRDVIVYLVPEMESQLINDEMVCANCLETLQITMKFIVKCLEVNEILSEETDEAPPISDSFLSEKCRDGEVTDINGDKVGKNSVEHDYCGGKNVSVGDIVSTEDVTISKVEEGEEEEYDDRLCKESISDDQYETVIEWGPNGEEVFSARVFSFQESAGMEEENMEEVKPLCCSICGETFDSKEDYQAHLQIHPLFICETCGKTFRFRDSLRAHRLSHDDPSGYICETCGKGCKDQGTLLSHMKTHNDVSFICDKCAKTFKNRRLLDIHIKYVHDKAYTSQCTICGILSKNETSLKTHMKLVHFKEKPFECDVCHKRFGRSDYLHNHKQRHTAERIVKSQPENRKVRTRTRMRYKIQDPGEPVPCKFCGQWYKDIVRLKRHLETHLKRYPCQFCPLTFPRNILCKRHEEMHQGGTVNFYRCNVCWKKFNTKETLNEHLKCHNNPQHFCDLCGKTFNRKFLLSHHKLVEHSNIPDKEQPEEIIYDSLLEVGGLSASLDGFSKD